MAGGTFVPASSLIAMSKAFEVVDISPPMEGMFTPRQAAVVGALRRGKANKIIAHDLRLSESTVKIHIRNIMKKLNATNRTEVVYKMSDLFPEEVLKIPDDVNLWGAGHNRR
jgi:DNA-binding NarL/FixJ family response regulator